MDTKTTVCTLANHDQTMRVIHSSGAHTVLRVRISNGAIVRAQQGVASELATRGPDLPSRFGDCLLVAHRSISERLHAAAHNEGIEPGELSDSAQYRLADGVVHYALALLGAQQRAQQLRAQAHRANVSIMLDWARLQRETDKTFSVLAFFEQWVIDGHPLHPAAKVRLGLSPAEVLDASPEWGNVINLPVVALEAGYAAEFGIAERHNPGGRDSGALTALLLREHPQLGNELAARGGSAGDSNGLTLLPLHPWQAAHVLENAYAPELRCGAIRLLRTHIPARPLISYRTVIPLHTLSTAWPSHLKTSLSVRLTNALRGISPAAAHNGPVVSRLLKQILHREGYFGDRLHVMSEPAAAHFQPTVPATPPSTALGAAQLSRSAALAVLARTNPEQGLSADELLIPVAALWARSPITGRPILAELLDRVRQTLIDTGRPSTRGASAQCFARRYAQVCLPPLLTLLTRYGIALEVHGENTVLVIRDGLPVRCIVRDFGGIRIHHERLTRAGLAVTLHPSSDIATCDANELRNKLYFALFVNDLSQLVQCLARCGEQPQASLWRHFGSVAHTTFADLATQPALADDATIDAEALLKRPWPNKALLTMWLRGDVTDYTYLPIANPFATSSGNL